VGGRILRFHDGTHVSAHFNVKEDMRTRARFATMRTWAYHGKYTVANTSYIAQRNDLERINPLYPHRPLSLFHFHRALQFSDLVYCA